MSSRSKGRSGRGYPTYPTQWSEWVWSKEYERHYRTRLRGPDDYEYEYEKEQAPSAQTPRTPAEGPGLVPTPDTYPQQQNYTTRTATAGAADVESLNQSFARTSISPSGGAYTAPYSANATPYSASPGSYPVPSTTSYASAPSYGAEGYASPSTGWQNHIRTRDPQTDKEEFDPHYKVHGAWQFKWGRIFKVLWAEPRGVDGGGSASGTSETGSLTVRKNERGKDMYAKVRRFVIIKPMEGHCICLPILTYSGQGVRKRGVHADHHAIIYSGKKPVAFRGEKERGLQMRSIKVSPDNPRHKLDDASRLNYAKTYTVEYNVKVWFIGKVSSDSEWQIRTDYNRVHPPLEIKGVRPADTADDTTEHTGGGTYGTGYPGYTAPYTSATYTTPYDSSSAYTQSSGQSTYEHAPQSHGNAAEGYTNSYFPASSSNTDYRTPSYTAGTSTTMGEYNTSDYYTSGHASSHIATGYEPRELHPVDEEQEQRENPRPEEQPDRRGHGQSRRKRQDPEPATREQSRRRRGDPEHYPEPEDEDYPEQPAPPPGDDDLYDC